MKNGATFKKRIAALFCALLLALLLPAAALADAWVPPDNHYVFGFETDVGARTVSLFVSNYAETGMTTYSAGTVVSKLCSVILKDLELNASQFKSGLSSGVDASGRQYLSVTAEKFEQRAKTMFPNSTVRASDCPGYSGGTITVSAANVNGAIDLVATVDNVTYEGDYVYYVTFTVWRVNVGSVSAIYGWTDAVPEAKVTELTGGACRFSYYGKSSIENISTWDLSLIDYQTNSAFADASAVLAPNEALSPASGSPATQPASDPPAESTQPEEAGETVAEPDTFGEPETLEQEPAQEGRGFLEKLFGSKKSSTSEGVVSARSGRTTLYLVIVLAVVVIVLLAVLIILVIVKKK